METNADKLREITGIIESIAFQLKHKDAGRFETLNDYTDWRAKAEYKLVQLRRRQRELLSIAGDTVLAELYDLIIRHQEAIPLTTDDMAIINRARDHIMERRE